MQFKILPFPHIVLDVSSLPKSFSATTNGPIIRILKDSPFRDALYIHERTHVVQFWVCSLIVLIPLIIVALTVSLTLLQLTPLAFIVHPLLYKCLQGYRYNAEISAYANQIAFYPADKREGKILAFTDHVLNWYDLDDLTYDEVRHDLLLKVG